MNHQNSGLDLEDQADVIQEIARSLVDEASGEWDLIRFVVNATCEVSDFKSYVQERGSERAVFSPTSAIKLSRKLREAMYQNGMGAWFIFTLDVSGDGAISTTFNYDDEPHIDGLDPVVFLTEQELFPRDRANQPDWFQERLTEGERLIAERTTKEH